MSKTIYITIDRKLGTIVGTDATRQAARDTRYCANREAGANFGDVLPGTVNMNSDGFVGRPPARFATIPVRVEELESQFGTVA